MDLNKVQGREVVETVAESEEKTESGACSVISENLDDLTDFPKEQCNPEGTQVLYALRKKTIRCIYFEQHRAYLKCPECSEYSTCTQLRREQRIELETSPFFSIKELKWEGPRRIKTMYIAVCTDGTLRRLDNFDPKNSDGINIDEYKDVEEVLVVTKAFRRKVIWAPVPLEQVKADQVDNGSMEETENLMSKDGKSSPAKPKTRKKTAKPKNG